MAVEILKPGEEWVYFTCDKCGCEFRATMDEVEYSASFRKKCPNCNAMVFDGTPETDYNKVKELEEWAKAGITRVGTMGRK